ncbi:hypothetical protein R3W88_033150 [Solanum pinnatisectum]|uniref:Uncharacterized protein n=1 Tax=Solanum pinnatisectum TaxID=50273 RepID=A0AAV9K1Y9_9SOLN|nr:hypothetical protein R3W88_033150 [Solanum pinnatisectum]
MWKARAKCRLFWEDHSFSLGKTIPYHWEIPFKYTRKRHELGIKWGKGEAQRASSYDVAY